jgi:hypothetical protein
MNGRLVALWCLCPAATGWTQPPPSTDVYIASLRISGDRVELGTVKNLTARPGYDNQPSFSADGRRLFYTSVRPGGPGGTTQADIFAVDLRSGANTAITTTPESEYSATPIPGTNEIAVIRVEADSTQRLWAFPIGGGNPRLVLERIKPVGYQTWLDPRTVGLFVLGSPATLQVADLTTGSARILLSGIGRALHRVPGRAAIAVSQLVSDNLWWIVEVDPATAVTKPLVRLPEGAEYFIWLRDGSLLSAAGSDLYRVRPGPAASWRKVVEVGGVGRISRMAMSPRGDHLAFVVEEKAR